MLWKSTTRDSGWCSRCGVPRRKYDTVRHTGNACMPNSDTNRPPIALYSWYGSWLMCHTSHWWMSPIVKSFTWSPPHGELGQYAVSGQSRAAAVESVLRKILRCGKGWSSNGPTRSWWSKTRPLLKWGGSDEYLEPGSFLAKQRK